jgi:hypothetical protein
MVTVKSQADEMKAAGAISSPGWQYRAIVSEADKGRWEDRGFRLAYAEYQAPQNGNIDKNEQAERCKG